MPWGRWHGASQCMGKKLPSSPEGCNCSHAGSGWPLVFSQEEAGEVSRAQCMQAEVAAKLRDYENY